MQVNDRKPGVETDIAARARVIDLQLIGRLQRNVAIGFDDETVGVDIDVVLQLQCDPLDDELVEHQLVARDRGVERIVS